MRCELEYLKSVGTDFWFLAPKPVGVTWKSCCPIPISCDCKALLTSSDLQCKRLTLTFTHWPGLIWCSTSPSPMDASASPVNAHSRFHHSQGNYWFFHVYVLTQTDPCPNTIRKSEAVQRAFTQLASCFFFFSSEDRAYDIPRESKNILYFCP